MLSVFIKREPGPHALNSSSSNNTFNEARTEVELSFTQQPRRCLISSSSSFVTDSY